MSVDQIYLIAYKYPDCEFFKPKNLKIFWVPRIKIKFLEELFFIFLVLIKVIFISELKKIHVVNCIGPKGLIAGSYLNKIFKITLICTIEMLNEKGSFLNNINYFITKILLTKAPIKKYICWSHYYWENHLKNWGIKENKVAIIPCGIDTEIYNPAVDGSDIKRKYASNYALIVFAKPLFYANSEMAKILVQVIALLKEKIKIKLLIGSGERKREVQMLAEDLSVLDQVEFMPMTPFPEIPKYIAAADLIVLPFTYAPTTSRSLLEAMAMGKPVVTTNKGEIPNIIKNGKEALLVNPIKEEIAKALERVLTDQVLSESLGRNATALVNKKYSLLKIVDKTIEVYTESVFANKEG